MSSEQIIDVEKNGRVQLSELVQEQLEVVRQSQETFKADSSRDYLKSVKQNTSLMASKLHQKLPDKEKMLNQMT